MDYSRIKDLMSQRSIYTTDLCKALEITEAGFYKMLRNKTMSVENLEKISDLLGVPISYWFDNFTAVPDNTDNALYSRRGFISREMYEELMDRWKIEVNDLKSKNEKLDNRVVCLTKVIIEHITKEHVCEENVAT